jgi:predicted ABC-type ATPase
MKPVLFIITGSNGAGKSTVGYTYLPIKIQSKFSVFDGDKLALSKKRELLKTIKSLKEASKLANEWMIEEFLEKSKTAIKRKDHFVYEGHFRDAAPLKVPKKFKRSGYKVSLIFMGLSDPELSALRVLERAKTGGHNVPVYEIHANFFGNLYMLNKHYKLFDDLLIIDSSKSDHEVLLHINNSVILSCMHVKNLPEWFIKGLPRLTAILKKEEERKSKPSK